MIDKHQATGYISNHFLNHLNCSMERFTVLYTFLTPNYREQGASSLVYMVDELIKESKNKFSDSLNNYKKLADTIKVLEEKNQKTILLVLLMLY